MPQQFKRVQRPTIQDVGKQSYDYYMRQINPQAVAATGRARVSEVGRSAWIDNALSLIDKGAIDGTSLYNNVRDMVPDTISIPDAFTPDTTEGTLGLSDPTADLRGPEQSELDRTIGNVVGRSAIEKMGVQSGLGLTHGGLGLAAAGASGVPSSLIAKAAPSVIGSSLIGSLLGPIGFLSLANTMAGHANVQEAMEESASKYGLTSKQAELATKATLAQSSTTLLGQLLDRLQKELPPEKVAEIMSKAISKSSNIPGLSFADLSEADMDEGISISTAPEGTPTTVDPTATSPEITEAIADIMAEDLAAEAGGLEPGGMGADGGMDAGGGVGTGGETPGIGPGSEDPGGLGSSGWW